MPKFKIGQRVKICRCARPDFWDGCGAMAEHIGEVHTITNVSQFNDFYTYYLKGSGGWHWDEDSLKAVDEQLLFDFMYDN